MQMPIRLSVAEIKELVNAHFAQRVRNMVEMFVADDDCS